MVSAKATGIGLGADVKRRNVPVLEASDAKGDHQQPVLAQEIDDKKEKRPVCTHALGVLLEGMHLFD